MNNQELTAKLQNPELLRLVSDNSDQQVSVLIQPDLPPPRVDVSRFSRKGVTFNSLTRIVPISTEEQEYANKQIDEISSFLQKLLGTSPHWLRSAQSFVARVPARELLAIASCPKIKAIWLNRELRR